MEAKQRQFQHHRRKGLWTQQPRLLTVPADWARHSIRVRAIQTRNNPTNQLTQRTHPCEIRALPKYYQPNSIKKCTPLWREAHFKVKMYKAPHACTTFGRWSVVLCGMGRGFSTLPKVSKTWGVCRSFKNDGRRGAFEEDLQRCIARGRRNTRDMFIRDVTRSGRWFPEKVCILEHQIFRFAKMILRDRWSTSYDLASLFRGRRSTLDRWSGKIAKCIGTRPPALHSTFHVWRKSRRIASFVMLQLEKLKGSRPFFFRCQAQKLRKSRRIAALLVSSSKIECR